MSATRDNQIHLRSKDPSDSRGALATFIAGIAAPKLQRVGKMLGAVAFHLDVPHRRIVRRNLKFIYPDWPPEKIRELSKHVFQNLGITITEILQMTCLSKEEILGKARLHGVKNLLEALKGGNGAIIISAHLGNWEMAALFAPLYLDTPITAVARKLRFEFINNLILNLRTRFGCKVIDKEEALPQMRKALRQGEILGILVDQGTRSSESVDITFFGHKVSATPAASLLALRCKSPVLPAFCVRDADGGLNLIIEPPLKLTRTQDLRADLKTNTQIMTDVVERVVSKYPEQWFWVHKRWKKYYPQLYPEYIARRKRRRARKFKKMEHKGTQKKIFNK
jgi:KDO2-lipid IV(A) lauroyltransferase